MKKNGNYAFIDGQNLNLGIRDQGWRLDYKRFRKYLGDKYDVTKVFIFIGYLPLNQSLYTALQTCGYILIFKPTLILPDGKVKGNVDAELVLHTMIEYDNYNKALIITGDGDFYCLVKYLRGNNKLLAVMSPNRFQCSVLLKKSARKEIVFMNDLKERLSLKRKGPHKDKTL